MRKGILVVALLVLLPVAAVPSVSSIDAEVKFATWNVRGYPEETNEPREWFSEQLDRIAPDLICIQEILDNGRVNKFLEDERFTKVAFQDSDSDYDTAIFVTDSCGILDITDPANLYPGFSHPPQAAYVRCGGLDAIVVNVHLEYDAWYRERYEKEPLEQAVHDLERFDPDVIICGDFNMKQGAMEAWAQEIGMNIMPTPGQENQGTKLDSGNRYDYFMVSRDVYNEEAGECWIEVFSGKDLGLAEEVSDHLPVVCEFRADEEYSDWD